MTTPKFEIGEMHYDFDLGKNYHLLYDRGITEPNVNEDSRIVIGIFQPDELSATTDVAAIRYEIKNGQIIRYDVYNRRKIDDALIAIVTQATLPRSIMAEMEHARALTNDHFARSTVATLRERRKREAREEVRERLESVA